MKYLILIVVLSGSSAVDAPPAGAQIAPTWALLVVRVMADEYEDVGDVAIASELRPPRLNEYWVGCAANFTTTHVAKCEGDCQFGKHYGPLLNDVAEYCGGSDIQPHGGAILTALWQRSLED